MNPSLAISKASLPNPAPGTRIFISALSLKTPRKFYELIVRWQVETHEVISNLIAQHVDQSSHSMTRLGLKTVKNRMTEELRMIRPPSSIGD